MWLLRIEEICRAAPWGGGQTSWGRTVRYFLGRLPSVTDASILWQSVVLQADLGAGEHVDCEEGLLNSNKCENHRMFAYP